MNEVEATGEVYDEASAAYWEAVELHSANPIDAAVDVGLAAGVIAGMKTERARIAAALRTHVGETGMSRGWLLEYAGKIERGEL